MLFRAAESEGKGKASQRRSCAPRAPPQNPSSANANCPAGCTHCPAGCTHPVVGSVRIARVDTVTALIEMLSAGFRHFACCACGTTTMSLKLHESCCSRGPAMHPWDRKAGQFMRHTPTHRRRSLQPTQSLSALFLLFYADPMYCSS